VSVIKQGQDDESGNKILFSTFEITTCEGCPRGGGVEPGSPPPPNKSKFKNRDFVDTVIVSVLRDLPINRNQLMAATLEV